MFSFLQDNVPTYMTLSVLKNLEFECIDHSPCPPDLPPSDYFLFSSLIKYIKMRTFLNDLEVTVAGVVAEVLARNRNNLNNSQAMAHNFFCLLNKDTNSFFFDFAGVFNDIFISFHSSFAMQLFILFRQQLNINVFSTILSLCN